MSPSEKPKKKRRIGLILIATVITVTLLIEAGLVIATFVSPTAAETFTAKIAQLKDEWNGTDEQPGIPSRVMTALDDFYQQNVVTLWSEPKPEAVRPTFATCESCHTDYQDRVRFTHVYMNHPVHAGAGLTCDECHTMVAHPSPDRPAEQTCKGCHDQVSQKGQCDYCHPPGTLPHFYLMGAPRDQYIDCATCHPRSTIPSLGQQLVEVGTFSGNPNNMCLECHAASNVLRSIPTLESPTPRPNSSPTPGASPTPVASEPFSSDRSQKPGWCQNCHGADHPSDWIVGHRKIALSGASGCVACHDNTWCAMKCHANTTMYRPPLIPLPSPEAIAP